MPHIPSQKLSPADQAAISQLLDLTQELIELGKVDEAANFLDQIEKHNPGDLNVPLQRGMLFMQKREYEDALKHFMIVYEKMPNYFPVLNNIGTAYFGWRKYNDAIIYYKKALEIVPGADFIKIILAASLMRRGYLDESVRYYKSVLKNSPEAIGTRSDMLMAMLYSESISPEDLAKEAEIFGEISSSLQNAILPHSNVIDKNKTLRIGYVSPDIREHPVTYFLEPLIQNHNKEKFEICAYSNTPGENPIMERMKKHIDIWHEIWGMDPEEVSNKIRMDQVDILIDVAGHTANNSLRVFAKKPAPIQVTWLGFPATTGLKTIDYKITDVYADPPGMTEHLNSETLWRLPHIFCCYKQHENSPDVIDHPPFEDNGYVTFGCFNNFVKVRDPVLAVWAKILSNVPNSRLLLEIEGVDEPVYRADVEDRLKAQGMPLERVILEPRKRSNQFVLYNKIDLALDPFPCVGGTTSMDALWMGVPLVTLAGRHFGSRMGVSILTNAGLPDLIAQNSDDYIAIASDLAQNLDKLRETRRNLRARFAASPAMDQVAFAKDMEDAYRQMWAIYCDKNA